MGVFSVSARRARKRVKHTTMTPVSSALINKVRAYGARKSQPSSSMLGRTASFAAHVPNRILMDIYESSSEVRCVSGKRGNRGTKRTM